MPELNQNKSTRPPIVVVLGHVNHGKSTLLDYIRKTNTVGTEAGGITQHVGAYETSHKDKDGKEHRLTFIDTPGHEAFSSIRSRGAAVADIAILVVAADEGVKPQTLEAIEVIKQAKVLFIVAINKIDKSGADSTRVKQELAETGVMVEGYGGDVAAVEISAKTGKNVEELLELVILSAQLKNIRVNPEAPATGFVLESHLDSRKGPTATLIVTDGTLEKGDYIVVEKIVSPAKILENFRGEVIERAGPGKPVRVIGFTEVMPVGSEFKTFAGKKEAEAWASQGSNQGPSLGLGSKGRSLVPSRQGQVQIPIILKADTLSSGEAIEKELAKLETDQVVFNYLVSAVGNVTENDIKLATSATEPIVLGFGVKLDKAATDLAENQKIKPMLFDVIYKLTEWLEKEVERRRPRLARQVILGQAKILKIFSQVKNKQIVGGQVTQGVIQVGKDFKIMRREIEIGQGRIKELQLNKMKVEKVEAGGLFGLSAEAKVAMAPGDKIAVIEILTE